MAPTEEPKMLPRFLEVQGQTYRTEDLLSTATHWEQMAGMFEKAAVTGYKPDEFEKAQQLMQSIRDVTGYKGPMLPYEEMLDLAAHLKIKASALEQTVFDAAE